MEVFDYLYFINKFQQAYGVGNRDQRLGQCLINTLHLVCKPMHDEIYNTELDCFYVDSRAETLLEYLHKNHGKKYQTTEGDSK